MRIGDGNPERFVTLTKIKVMDSKPALLSLTPEVIRDKISQHGLPKFAVNQICEWIYKKRATSFDDMTNISKKHRELLAQRFVVGFTPPAMFQTSKDGTIKYLFKTSKDLGIEAVFIPEDDRATLCISSQVGCKFNCSFCLTGKQGFQANLTAAEILNQIYSLPQFDQITNIVFMGMGEPFDNLEEVLSACAVLTSDWGLAWSPRRITVSTVGILDKLPRFLEETQCHLAISLHSPFSEDREKLMPVQKASKIESVLQLLRQHDWRGQRRLSFEYIMFDGINDTPQHLKGLTTMLKGIFCRINLIRYHEIPQLPYKTSTNERMVQFRDTLTDNNIIATIRRSRGQDISAACGMLYFENKT